MNKNQLLKGLQRIAAPESAPFDELATREAVHQWLAELKLTFDTDPFGNTLFRIRRGHARRQVVFVAHLDHPALRVDSVAGRQIKCHAEGGLPTVGLRGAKVLFPRTEAGLLKGKVESVKTDGDKQRPRVTSAVLRVTGGAKSPLPKAGDFAVLDLPALKRNGNKLKMRAADDITGVAAIIATLATLGRGNAAVDAMGVLTRGEEVGFHGAMGLAIDGRLPRDAAIISVECSQAYGDIKPGKGPVVRLGDRTGPFNPRACALLIGAAKALAKKLDCQTALMAGGSCEATAFSSFGYEVAGIALPLLGYHNQGPRGVVTEEIDLRDLEGAIKLMVGVAERAGAGIEDLDLLRNELILQSQEGRERLREPIDPITGYPRSTRF